MKISKTIYTSRYQIFFIWLLCVNISSCTDDCSLEESTPASLIIGGIAPLSGDASNYGRVDKLITDLSVDYINEAGGINGRPVEVVWLDSKCSPEISKNRAQELIDRGITIILGDGCSGATLAASTVTEPNEVILITSISSSDLIKDAGDFVFRVQASDRTGSTSLAQYANNNYLKLGIIAEETAYAQSFAEGIFNEFNGEVFKEDFPSIQTDFTDEITDFINQGVNAIAIIPQTTVKMRVILEQLENSGWQKGVIGNEMIFIDESITTDYKDLFVTWDVVSTDFVPPSSSDLDNLKNRFQLEYGEELRQLNYAATTYDRNEILFMILKSIHNENETKRIRDSIYNIQNYIGLSGTLSFDTFGEVNLTKSLLIWDGGKFVPAN